MLKHFWKSHLTLLVISIGAYFLGGLSALFVVLLLGALELSLSFDNAVVNAKVLETMSVKWRKRFITWGIPIAVFGMRFIFPIAIVGVVADLNMFEAYNLALNDQEGYKAALEAKKEVVYAFGGAFLLMVFLDWFFDDERDKWLTLIEDNIIMRQLKKLSHAGMLVAIGAGITLAIKTQSVTIIIAYLIGVLLYELVSSVDDLFETEQVGGQIVRAGFVGFLYLELLDAAFSFDGVIGAFALSSNIFIIAAGLMIGAMYVRCLTIYMVEQGTLSDYRYLEHGAHYAIGALATIMFVKMFMHINEVLVASVGVGFILIAFAHSIYLNKKEQQ